MRKRCRRKGVYQEWPTKGNLKDNMNHTLYELIDALRNQQGVIYSYVLTTLKKRNGEFIQTGSGPNFQSDLITLCTCKHLMRTWRDVPNWKDVWIAGFTGINLMKDKRNYLFYLMKVSKSFSSHKTIWNALADAIKTTKNAQLNPCGDVYRPKPDIKNEFNYLHYYPPVKNHVHATKNLWRKDITYEKSRSKRKPALLVGDTTFSFLWSLPIVFCKNRHPRTKRGNIQDFIQNLLYVE